MNYDHYQVAREIIQNLRQENKYEWADKLEDAIDSGSTGNEIFMALRWHLQQLKSANVSCQVETASQIDDLINELSKALE